jgi:imidazolonepropionase
LGIISDGSVLIRERQIAEVGSTRRLENLKEARAAIEIPADGRIIVPGFVDPNLTLNLDAAGEKHKRKNLIEFCDNSLSLLRSCLQHGTLTAELKASAGEHNFNLDLALLRRLAQIGTNPICTVRTWRLRSPPPEQHERELLAMVATITRRKLVRFIEFAGRCRSAVDLQWMSAVKGADLSVKLTWPGGSPDELAHCLEQLHPSTIDCVAPSSLTAAEAVILAASPLLVLAAGKQVFEGPASGIGRQLADAGAAIALSSGYDSASAASFSMQMSLALAVARLGLTVEEGFSAATINAAHAVGRGDVVGSIETGKWADLLLLDVSDYRDVPSQFGVNHVGMAIRDGNVVLNRTRWKVAQN